MLFWAVITVLAAAVAGLIALALLRHQGAVRARADYDIAVYRDQLARVEDDLARGVITEDAAERMRTEISRRILDSDRQRTAETARTAPAWLTRAAAGLTALALVGGSLALYAATGAPGYGDLPLQARLETSAERRADRPGQAEAEAEMAGSAGRRPSPRASDPEFVDLVERLRETVESRPDDPRGLELLARNEAALGNFEAAYEAQGRLIETLGAEAEAGHYADFAELMIIAAGGYVSPEAEQALGKALARNPDSGPARYYMGLLESQTGRPDRAFRVWRDLLEQSSPDAPWVPLIRNQIRDVAARAGVNYRPPERFSDAAPGPSRQEMEAAADMPEEARMEMIRGMVEGLSQRLADEGGSPQDWARLINALGVLGDGERARAIFEEARSKYADNDAALDTITAAARRAGVAQ